MENRETGDRSQETVEKLKISRLPEGGLFAIPMNMT
jgi:hypothetical protein